MAKGAGKYALGQGLMSFGNNIAQIMDAQEKRRQSLEELRMRYQINQARDEQQYQRQLGLMGQQSQSRRADFDYEQTIREEQQQAERERMMSRENMTLAEQADLDAIEAREAYVKAQTDEVLRADQPESGLSKKELIDLRTKAHDWTGDLVENRGYAEARRRFGLSEYLSDADTYDALVKIRMGQMTGEDSRLPVSHTKDGMQDLINGAIEGKGASADDGSSLFNNATPLNPPAAFEPPPTRTPAETPLTQTGRPPPARRTATDSFQPDALDQQFGVDDMNRSLSHMDPNSGPLSTASVDQIVRDAIANIDRGASREAIINEIINSGLDEAKIQAIVEALR